MLDQIDVVAAPRHRLAAPEQAPHLDVLFQAAHPTLVVGATGRPLALGGRQAPADSETEHDAAARDLIDVGDLVGEDDGMTQRRQQHGRAQAHARRDAREIGEGRQRFESRLGHDAVADPDRVVPGRFGVAGHRPALVDGRAASGLDHDPARWNEDADLQNALSLRLTPR